MSNEILVLDIETTGLNPKTDFILELGMVELDLNSGRITVLFDQVFKDPKLTAKHRSSWIFENGFMQINEVRNALPLSEYSTGIQEILNRYCGRITAWNRDFDSSFLKTRGFDLGPDIHCPMKESVNYFKLQGPYGYKWPKAQEAWDFLFPETTMVELHRGLADSKMEAAIIYELYQRRVYKPFLV